MLVLEVLFLSTKKVLVTGGTGFLGYHIIKYLVSKGFEVIGIGRNSKNEIKKLGGTFIKVDLSLEEDLEKLPKDFDYIVHCAGFSSPWGKDMDFISGNIVCTKNILKFAKWNENLKKFINISTSSVYFDFTDRYDIKEEDRLPDEFVNSYAETKYKGETLVRYSGLKYITLRPRGIYGEYDKTIFPRLIRLNRRVGIPYLSDKKIYTSLTYGGNIAYAIYLAMVSDIENRTYNVSDEIDVTLDEVLEKVFSLLNIEYKRRYIPPIILKWIAKFLEWRSKTYLNWKEPVFTNYSLGVLSYSETLNIDRIKKELGYSPIYTIEEGIKNFIDWYRKDV